MFQIKRDKCIWNNKILKSSVYAVLCEDVPTVQQLEYCILKMQVVGSYPAITPLFIGFVSLYMVSIWDPSCEVLGEFGNSVPIDWMSPRKDSSFNNVLVSMCQWLLWTRLRNGTDNFALISGIPAKPYGIVQAKCVASVTNCGLWLETAMAPTVNRGWHIFTNG